MFLIQRRENWRDAGKFVLASWWCGVTSLENWGGCRGRLLEKELKAGCAVQEKCILLSDMWDERGPCANENGYENATVPEVDDVEALGPKLDDVTREWWVIRDAALDDVCSCGEHQICEGVDFRNICAKAAAGIIVVGGTCYRRFKPSFYEQIVRRNSTRNSTGSRVSEIFREYTLTHNAIAGHSIIDLSGVQKIYAESKWRYCVVL
ncbi:hypothetical protein Tco_0907773 [Tanacetum coccineum]|uniref:Uncharacterized protein n=1 Tax=Tanacetum coccineum TaxID=301880 RepID=A0ABQ5CMF6_9ASTR